MKSRAHASARRRSPSGSVWVTIGFSVVIVTGVTLLGAAVVTGPVADARHTVVTVDGEAIDRTELRARMTLDAELQEAREAVLRTATTAGLVSAEDATRIADSQAAEAADPLRTAVDGLVRDALMRTEARSLGLAASADVRAELERAVTSSLDRRVAIVTIAEPSSDPAQAGGDWPRPALRTTDPVEVALARSEAATRVVSALADGTSLTDVADGLRLAGWRVTAGERWLPADGPLVGIPDGFLAAMRRDQPGEPPVVVEDRLAGLTAIGFRLDAHVDRDTAAGLIDQAAIDGGALGRWAEARAAERALRDQLASTWTTAPSSRIRVAELVIGAADLEGPPGPYRSFAHVVVRGLAEPIRKPAEPDDALGARLAGELMALPPDERANRFEALAAAANATPSTDPLDRSGELGYFTKDQLLPAIAELAFAEDAESGAVIGPVTTIVGAELFLLRGRFEGILDERANAALVEARTTTDLAGLAVRISPAGEAGRADGTLWRALDESAGDPVVRRAYADTPIGTRSDPVVIDSEIVVIVPLERSNGIIGTPELDRLLVRGFDAWLAARTAEASIVRDAEPLPGIVVESAAPTGSSPIGSGPPSEIPSTPVAPLASPRTFPLATPRVIP